MKRVPLAVSILFAVACGSPREAVVAQAPVDPPVVTLPSDAGVLAAPPPAPPTSAPASSGEYLDLLRPIDAVEPTPEREKVVRKAAFEHLRELADPRAGDGLVAYLEKKPRPRWRTEAAITLAELGDLRAVPHLAWRLEQDPLKLYDEKIDPELRRDDHERVVAARVLADLLLIHEGRREEIGKAAEASVLAWTKGKPQPHANALLVQVAANIVNHIEQC